MNHSSFSPATSPEKKLDLLLLQSPLSDPPAWFVTQTMARIRSEVDSQEKTKIQFLWSAIGALSLVILWGTFEIRDQSLSATSTLAWFEFELSETSRDIPWLDE